MQALSAGAEGACRTGIERGRTEELHAMVFAYCA